MILPRELLATLHADKGNTLHVVETIHQRQLAEHGGLGACAMQDY